MSSSVKFDNNCDVILCSKCKRNKCFIIYPTNAEKMMQHVTGSQTKHTSIAALTCFVVMATDDT